MERFLVGGAVRDELLGLPVTDRDWVVVGATPEELVSAGYTQVGRDFPVFLHPETQEEYALARTERKTAPGHRGFIVHAGREVSLEEDLLRRDLTINAIARNDIGELIDPFGGQRDLADRVLRHVSPAFEEDPLRVFRVARFAAVFPEFTLAPETRALMLRMGRGGLLRELSAERVAQELLKMLSKGGDPQRFFAVLAEVAGLEDWFPEWQGIEPPRLASTLEDEGLRYAALCQALPVSAIDALGERLRINQDYTRLAVAAVRWGDPLRHWRELSLEALAETLVGTSAFRTNSLLDRLARLFRQQHAIELEPLVQWVSEVGEQITGKTLIASGGKPGPQLGETLMAARLSALDALRRGGATLSDEPDAH